MQNDVRCRIAIDGPSGVGKSTAAKIIATALDIDYIDTGAMYRAIALKILGLGIDIEKDSIGLAALLDETEVDFSEGKILLDGEDVSHRIRTPEVTAMASTSSALPVVREKLVSLQREMGMRKSVVMDGRDIGTNVFKDAEVKFFMTASAEVRARRRCDELISAGAPAAYDEVLAAINERDYNDSHRTINPLTKADDAIEIDTDELNVDEVAARMLSKVIERLSE
jgi:cytidylate kinase